MDLTIAAETVTQQLPRAIGQHLVDVHIGGSSGAALDGVADKLLVPAALDQLIGGLTDGLTLIFLQETGLHITDGGSLLDLCQTDNHLGVDGLPSNMEVLLSPQTLNAIIGLCRHLQFAD